MKNFPVLLVTLLLPACSFIQPVEDDPVRHILESTVSGRTPLGANPAVAVANPSLPPYLERVELVTRTGDGRVKIHEDDLWSEPLDAGITRVVADNMRKLTGSTNVQPSKNFIGRDYSELVEIRIDRFDPLPGGNLLLECTWKVQPIGGGDASPRAFRTEVPVAPTADDAINPMSGRIVAMNEALERLSRKIAGSL